MKQLGMPSALKIGTGYLRPGSVAQITDQAREAERLGYDLFGIADSQALGRELYTALGPVANATQTLEVGPTITNPVTRHPVVTASAIASLDEFSEGRVILGIGSGDSAVHTIGEPPARLETLETTIDHMRTLWAGESIELDGKTVRLRWLEGTPARDIPIALAAEGPKTLELAGRVADRVIMGLGITPDVITTALDSIADGARERGRDPNEIETWVFAHGNIADDRETAVDDIKMALAGSAHHSLQFSMEGKCVPDDYRDALVELLTRYDPDQHEQRDATVNRHLVDELNLTPYLAERYAVAGTPDDCIATLRTLRDIDGVDGILLTSHAEEKRSAVQRFGQEVVPHV